MGEERGERPDSTDREEPPADESTETDGLEPTGGPRRVVSEESVDDVVASLKSTQTAETGLEADRADADSETENASNGPSSAPPSETDASTSQPSDDASPSQPPPESTAEPTPGTVDVDDLSEDAGPLARRLRADSEGNLTGREPGTYQSVEPEPTASAGNESPAESGRDERDCEERESASGPARGVDPDAPATDVPATDAPATDVPATDAPATDAPATDVPATDAPATDVPATDAPATDAPATDVPATDAPATDAPATDVPATDAPATDVPATDAPATDAPATDDPDDDQPSGFLARIKRFFLE